MSTKNQHLDNSQHEIKPVLCDFLSDEHIEVIARKVALRYAYTNEYSYDIYTKAIVEGIKIGRSVMFKKTK